MRTQVESDSIHSRHCTNSEGTLLADPFRIIAHRGASAYAPENTMAAFELAVSMGLDEVETDVHLTKDGHLLLLHDHSLDRTTDGSGLPADFTLEELKRLDAGSWMLPSENPGFVWIGDFGREQLVTLDELLERYGDDLTYHVEIKDTNPAIVPAVVKCVQSLGCAGNVFIYTINNAAFLDDARRLAPDIRTELAPNGLIRDLGPEKAIEQVAAKGHNMVVLSARNQSRWLVELAHGYGIEARSSGIRSRGQMIEAVEIGCNGMTINWPDWLMDYITEE